MKEYIGEIIGAVAVILAAIIGLWAKKSHQNKQSINNVNNSNVNQANGSITIEEKKDKKE